MSVLIAASLLALPAAASNSADTQRDLTQGEWGRAEQASRHLLQTEPSSVAAELTHARALAELKQPYAAIVELQSFLDRNPQAGEVWQVYGDLLDNVARDGKAAEEAWRKAANLLPASAQPYLSLGHLYASEAKGEEAVAAYLAAKKRDGHSALICAGLGFSYAIVGKSAEGEQEFREALALPGGTEPSVQALYGGFLRDTDKLEESVEAFTRSIQANPNIWQTYYERGMTYARLHRWAEVERDGLEALRLGGNRRDARVLLVKAYRGLNKSAEVDEQLAAVKRLNAKENEEAETSRELRRSLGEAESALGRHNCPAAIPAYEHVVTLLPTFYEAYFPLGICYSQMGKTDAAQKALQQYLGYQDLSADGHAALGLAYIAGGNNRSAKGELERAINLDPAEDEAREALGEVLLREGQPAQAAEQFAQLLTADQPQPPTYRFAAEAALAQGRADEARRITADAVQRYPSDEALQRLRVDVLLECHADLACRTAMVQTVRNAPNAPVYLRGLARAMILERPADQATADYLSRLETRMPGDAETGMIVARWSAGRNRCDDAESRTKAALAASTLPNSLRVEALTIMANCDVQRAASGQAKFLYSEAWRLNQAAGLPNSNAALDYHTFLVSTSAKPEAKRVLNAILVRYPHLATARLAAARDFTGAGDAERAIGEAKEALADTTDPQLQQRARLLLVKNYLALGRTKDADNQNQLIRAMQP